MDEQAWHVDELREEARYRRERLALYRARMYGGRAPTPDRANCTRTFLASGTKFQRRRRSRCTIAAR